LVDAELVAFDPQVGEQGIRALSRRPLDWRLRPTIPDTKASR